MRLKTDETGRGAQRSKAECPVTCGVAQSIIDIYARRQAIEDGVLVQRSGPGYQGDHCR